MIVQIVVTTIYNTNPPKTKLKPPNPKQNLYWLYETHFVRKWLVAKNCELQRCDDIFGGSLVGQRKLCLIPAKNITTQLCCWLHWYLCVWTQTEPASANKCILKLAWNMTHSANAERVVCVLSMYVCVLCSVYAFAINTVIIHKWSASHMTCP